MRKFIFSVLLPLMVVSFSLSAAADIDFGTALGINTAIGIGLSSLGMPLVPGGSLAVMSSTMIDDFKTKFGAWYKPGGQNANSLRQLLWQDSSSWDAQFTMTPLEGDVLEYGYNTHTRVLQPFKPYWSPTGQLSGTPRRIKLQRVKVNVAEIPDFLVNTWLGFLATESRRDPNVDRTTWPFVRWYVEVWLIGQAKQDLFLNESFCGIYADPGTNGTAGAAGTAIDGLAYKINLDIDAGNIVPISTGALVSDPEDFVTQIEDFCDAVDNRYRGMNMTLNMHDTYFQRFIEGMHEKYNVFYPQVADGRVVNLRRRTHITVQGHVNMLQSVGGAASQKIWMTPKTNAGKFMRVGGSDEAMLRVESQDYNLKLFNDFHIAYDYYDPRIMFTNDVETDLPV